MRASARPEAVAVLAEGRIKDRLQHLQQSLLDQAIRHRRDAELTLATARLRDRHPTYRHSAGTFLREPGRGWKARPCADARRSGRCPVRQRRPRPCWPAHASRPVAGSPAPGPPIAAPAPCSPLHDADGALRRCPARTRLHRVLPQAALRAQASDALRPASSSRRALPRSALRRRSNGDYYGLC